MNRNIIAEACPTPLQQGMLFHHLRDPHAGADVEQIVVHLPEPIDPPRMVAAWQWLVQRHAILRTRFAWNGGQPRLEILSKVRLPFGLETLSRLSSDTRRDRLREFLDADRVRGFALDCAPLQRLTLFAWEPASFTLVWTFHHALLDGRAFAALLREVFEAYDELAAGQVAPRPTPPDYRRHLDWLQLSRHDNSDAFWRGLLAGVAAPTPLVVDRHTVSGGDGPRHADAWEHLDAETTGRLRALAASHDVTMNAIVMGAWATLLHRYSGDHEIVFGATRACRRSSVADADRTIGLFINTVPVRVTLRGDEPLVSVFQAIRRQWLDMRPHEHTPLARIKNVSQVPASQPLFESLVVFERSRLDAELRALGGPWAARDVELHEFTSLPVTLAAYDGEALSLKIAFDRHRIENRAGRRMAGHVRRLLESVAQNPQALVRDAAMVADAERRELIELATPAAACPSSLPADGGATLHALFEARAAGSPHAVAVGCDGVSLTYARLNATANRLARALVQRGVGPGTLVGLCVDRSNDLIVAILAILKAGGAYVPLDPSYPADRLAFMLKDAGSPVLLTQTALAGALPSTPAAVVCLDDILARPGTDADEANLDRAITPDDLAYVIYTSGTTGKPKGSLITHRNVVRLFPASEPCYEFGSGDVWTLFHSCAFDFSVWELWGALLYGGRLVVVPFLVSRSPEAFLDLLVNEQVTVLSQTPSAFRQLMHADDTRAHGALHLRYVIFGGEALDVGMLAPWFARHGDRQPQLVNMYGITETTVHVTYRCLSSADLGAGSVIGVPLGDLQLHVLDRQRQPVPLGVPGELYVGGAGLGRGYLNRPELTDERFVPDHLSGRAGGRLYQTGDLARRVSGHDIEYLGRIDDQVKIRGFRIELGEIESVLRQHAVVFEAAVIAREDEPGVKQLAAYLVTTSAVDVNVLREHLQAQLPDYMVPASFTLLVRMPLTTNGKVDRAALPAPERHRPELSARYVGPRTPAEHTLAAIWSKVLRVEEVGVHDNFFALGGDSILSIQVISLARAQGLELTPRLLFANQTVAALASAAPTTTPAAPAPVERVAGAVPLTPIQSWFFEQELEDRQHYNQGFLLETRRPLERGRLHTALEALRAQHDALRLRYICEGTAWRQSYGPSDEPLPLAWTEMTAASADEERRLLQAIAADAHASLSLEDGPLWRVVYVSFGPHRAGRLLFVVHHLAVDGVSWRPLLEDLETAYLQLEAGEAVRLPAKTSSYQFWAERLRTFAGTDALQSERDHWVGVAPLSEDGAQEATAAIRVATRSADDTVGASSTLTRSLSCEETHALLQEVPAAYRTQVNDVLLTALLRAWTRATGSRTLVTDVEGHGREPLFEDVDVSRTVGWFTSIFPVRLEVSDADAGAPWQPGRALKSVKEQLRRTPRRGIGYGVLRYAGEDRELSAQSERQMVFNYLGQFDQTLAGSRLFSFARESSGPWRSLTQHRRHEIELNALVRDGRLELAWTYGKARHGAADIVLLADGLLDALRELIAHCRSVGAFGRTPSDFPLASLTGAELDRLVADRPGVEDIYPLSPIQQLFWSANARTEQAAFDQWQCTLRGTLDVAAYQEAWSQLVRRHAVLRSTIHGDAVSGPVQLVHRDVSLPWTIEDWRAMPPAQQTDYWLALLARDLSRPLPLAVAPPMRFALVRLADDAWKFLWTLPALLLDGWSWPLAFREASLLYEACATGVPAALGAVHQYREYIEWIGAQPPLAGQEFWRSALAGFREPTPLGMRESSSSDQSGADGRYVRAAVPVSADAAHGLTAAARRHQITLSAILQGAWAILLGRHSGARDVVFGAAFNGRPADLTGADAIIGPFVNNLPVRVPVDAEMPADAFFAQLHTRALELASFQCTSLVDIQRASDVPWRHRLFDSLVVFQNYAVDASARRMGTSIAVEDFVGPIHTNYPVLLLADPEPTLRLTFIYDRQRIDRATVERWTADLAVLLERIPDALATRRRVGDLQARLSPAAGTATVRKHRLAGTSRSVVPPQTEMERTVAAVWQDMFETEQVGMEENVFDLGGTSLLIVRMHEVLQKTVGAPFPIVTLFEHPTVRGLANHLDRSMAPVSDTDRWRRRADQQKHALGRMRSRSAKPQP